MNKQKHHLIKVDPRKVTVNESLLKPTKWDLMAVEDDLIRYVSLSHVVKATPQLGIVDGQLVVISGLPFIYAARQATPPLNEVVCLLEPDDKIANQCHLQHIEASALLDLYSENKIYWAVETLTFWQEVIVERQQLVEAKILSFFKAVSANPNIYGGDYLSLSEFYWEYEPSRVTWKWKRSDREGKHVLVFLELLSNIDQEVALIKSWNGMDFKKMSAVSEL